ncbi:MAG: helix-turn-helix domain-containing protein [Panacagrimonas sp.]
MRCPFPPPARPAQRIETKELCRNTRTLGEHVKRHRTILGLTQKEAAEQFEVDAITVLNWEKGKTNPPTAAIPAIVRFLGYDPDPSPQPATLPERILACRRDQGWSRKKAARQFGVDEGTWGEWERGKPIPWRRKRERLEAFLGGALEAPHGS